jgi:hypothetical protein
MLQLAVGGPKLIIIKKYKQKLILFPLSEDGREEMQVVRGVVGVPLGALLTLFGVTCRYIGADDCKEPWVIIIPVTLLIFILLLAMAARWWRRWRDRAALRKLQLQQSRRELDELNKVCCS